MSKTFKFLIIFISIFSCFFFYTKTYAAKVGGYRYIDSAFLYSDTTLPQSVAKDINNEENKIIPVSDTAKQKKLDYRALKSGKSSRTNILGLVEYGDAGILKAAKNGRIKKVHYVEVTREKLYVPLGFIPVYFNRFITTVYGE